jgi:hypothetical protein
MHLAGGLTPLLVTALLAFVDWRTLFALFGSWGSSGRSPGIDGSVILRAFIRRSARASAS